MIAFKPNSMRTYFARRVAYDKSNELLSSIANNLLPCFLNWWFGAFYDCILGKSERVVQNQCWRILIVIYAAGEIWRVWLLTVPYEREEEPLISFHYSTQLRCRRPAAIGIAKKAVGIGCADGGRRHKAVGLDRRRHSQKDRRHRHAVGIEG
jgi:hypothetical protein